MTGAGRPALAAVRGSGQDQVPRLAAFTAAYPHARVYPLADGPWQACITEADGEAYLTRYTLKELLDKLGELLGEPPPDRGG